MAFTQAEQTISQPFNAAGGAVNKRVVIAVAVIAGTAVLRAWFTGQGITKILIGAYLLLIILSVVDLFGGVASTVAGGIAFVAMLVAILSTLPDILAIFTGGGGGGVPPVTDTTPGQHGPR